MEQQRKEQKKPTLEITLEGIERIEDQVQQWMILDEHYTRNNLDRRLQLDYAQQYCKGILAEIRKACERSPHCSDLVLVE